MIFALKGAADTNNLLPELPKAQADALLSLFNQGRLTEFSDQAHLVLQEFPKSFDIWNLLGVARWKLGQFEQAEQIYAEICNLFPNSAEAYNYRGAALGILERHEEALASFEKATTLKPNYVEAYNNIGSAFANLERYEEAIESYRKALQLNPSYAQAYDGLGNTFAKLSRYNEAIDSYGKALELYPAYAVTYNKRRNALVDLVRRQHSYGAIDNTTDKDIGLAEYYAEQGNFFIKLACYEDAFAAYDKAISINPKVPAFFNSRGNALANTLRYEDALIDYHNAIDLNPEFAEAYNNRGNVLAGLARYDEALSSYDRAIQLQPNYAELYFSKSLVCLGLGDFSQGWRLFEFRKRLFQPMGRKISEYPESAVVSDLVNKKVLIHAEQGLGDTLQFCRYVLAVSTIAASVHFSVQAPLLELLSHSFPEITVIAEPNTPSALDVHCPLMSLPFLFGTKLDTIPANLPYLYIDKQKSCRIHKCLSEYARPHVGLVWNGGLRPHQPELGPINARRNMSFELMAGINRQDITFFSLQKGEPAESEIPEQIKRYWPTPNFHNLSPKLKDFTDTAAVIDNLDLVITVDTSVAHLAGALGKPVWILNRFDACWRWLINRSDSPWYPSARLFRQPQPGAWQPVIEQVKAELIRQFGVE